MKKVFLLLAAGLLLGGSAIILNLVPEAEIVVEALSPQEIHDCMGGNAADCPVPEGVTLPDGAIRSTGLAVVGNGERVYLSVREASGEDVLSVAWSVTSMPDGSSATVTSIGGAWATFRTDVPGQYSVDATVTTASGAASTSVVITGAEYVGVGTIAGATPDFVKGQCGACHPGNAADWALTGHASFFEEAIDGLQSDHYNEACISCHTLGFNEDPLAVNGAFDDVARDLGWTFPATLQDGNWDDIVQNYPALAQVSNIQCESCHGPGSLHKGDVSKIELSLDEGLCGQCHEEDPYHRRSSMWKNSAHATGASFARGTSASCAPCHSGWGFIAKVDPQSNLDQVTGAQPVTCAVCHDPHSAANPDQLRRVADVTLQNGVVITWGGNGKLCMNCHTSRRDAEEYVKQYSDHFGPHRSNQTDMLAGTNAINFGRYIPNSTHRNALDDACVSCHMFETPGVGEPGRDFLGDHTWAMRAEVDGVLLENVATCERCHGTLASFDDIMARADYDRDGTVESAKGELHGMMDKVGMLLPPIGEPEVVVAPDYTPLQLKTAYNYFFVEEDGSEGMHNFQFSINLLQLTYDVLSFGVLTEGFIETVTDVPNDQGGQVSAVWSRFGGDGPSDAPVQIYYVWRKVDEAAASKNAKATFTSLEDVPADPELMGASVMFSDELWTQVGSQPAAQMERYSAVVPTLGDSTKNGIQWSTFMVSGHTSDSQNFVMSMPMDGYSVDNLVPQAPAAISATVQNGGVTLAWETTSDTDVDYYAVYRYDGAGIFREVANSDLEPIATVTGTAYTDADATPGKTWSYRVVAFDFSGNRGEWSDEVQASVATGVDQLTGVPTEFTLNQNYPNPFNPSTQIEFAVPESGDVKISIFDLSGKEVGVLVDRQMAPGRYSVTWDAGNLASGLYFYKMQTRTFSQSKTMLLVK